MRWAAHAATIGFAALMVFEAALAAGAPLGEAAWGGSSADLTTGQRIASAISVVFYGAAIVVVRRRAAGRAGRLYRWGTWALVVIFVLAAVANVASDSPWENYLLAPLAVVLAGCCFGLAKSAGHAAHGRVVTGREVGAT